MENKTKKIGILKHVISDQVENAYQEFLTRFVDFENGEDPEGYFVERKVDNEVGIRNCFPYSESSVLDLDKVFEKIRDLRGSYHELGKLREKLFTSRERSELRSLDEIKDYLKEGHEWTEEREVALFKMFRDGLIS